MFLKGVYDVCRVLRKLWNYWSFHCFRRADLLHLSDAALQHTDESQKSVSLHGLELSVSLRLCEDLGAAVQALGGGAVLCLLIRDGDTVKCL